MFFLTGIIPQDASEAKTPLFHTILNDLKKYVDAFGKKLIKFRQTFHVAAAVIFYLI